MRRERVALGLALLAGLFVFPSVEGTTRALLFLPAQIARGRRALDLASFRVPRGGEWVLPEETRSMLALLRAAGAEDFRPSERVRASGLLLQRIVEGAYPIRAAETSHWLVMFADEATGPGCAPVAADGKARLVRCP